MKILLVMWSSAHHSVAAATPLLLVTANAFSLQIQPKWHNLNSTFYKQHYKIHYEMHNLW